MRLDKRYAAMTVEQRQRLAEAAGIKPEYLYQLATRFKGKQPSMRVLLALATADPKLTARDMAAEFAEVPARKVAV